MSCAVCVLRYLIGVTLWEGARDAAAPPSVSGVLGAVGRGATWFGIGCGVPPSSRHLRCRCIPI